MEAALAPGDCEWAVNAHGEVLAATPRFYRERPESARIVDGRLDFVHDGGQVTSAYPPAPVVSAVLESGGVLLVAFGPGDFSEETDLPVSTA